MLESSSHFQVAPPALFQGRGAVACLVAMPRDCEDAGPDLRAQLANVLELHFCVRGGANVVPALDLGVEIGWAAVPEAPGDGRRDDPAGYLFEQVVEFAAAFGWVSREECAFRLG